MTHKNFHLLEGPWIVATDLKGCVVELSLSEVFDRAHELRELSGELPAQDAAILRLLLGVLYAVFTRVDETGKALELDEGNTQQMKELWKRLWKLERFPDGLINEYLQQYRDRFWLVHSDPKMPLFWQVRFDKDNPPINSEGIKRGPTGVNAVKLIGDIANHGNHFCGRTETDKIGFSEAARWLVYLNAFDVSPGGNPGKIAPSIKGYGHPWPADIGLTWISGNTLFQTLMLNLVLLHNQEYWPQGGAWWETDPPCLTVDDMERIEVNVPQSIVTLMSMQYRYVRLQTDGSGVTGFELWSGVRFESENAWVEKMTPWRKNRTGQSYPHKHNASKQMWRDLSSLLPKVLHDEGCPGVIKWMSGFGHEQISLPVIFINTVGIEYKKDTAVADVFSDSLSINAGLMSELHHNWIKRITDILGTTDNMIESLGSLAFDLAKVLGGSEKTKQEKEKLKRKSEAAKEECYFRLDMPFRDWLAGINPVLHESEESYEALEHSCDAWIGAAKGIIIDLGGELVSEAGVQGFTGRKSEGKRWLTAPEVYSQFIGNIEKTLRKSK